LRPNGPHDPVRNDLCFLVRPKTENAPSTRRERVGIALVARDVPFDLLAPVLLVRAWPSVMRRASVPEAAVDEDLQSRARSTSSPNLLAIETEEDRSRLMRGMP
jgi:hypothetical protein